METFKGRYRVESARLQGRDYRAAGWHFATACTKDRVPFFGDVINGGMVLSPIGRIVAEEWQRTPEIRSNVVPDGRDAPRGISTGLESACRVV